MDQRTCGVLETVFCPVSLLHRNMDWDRPARSRLILGPIATVWGISMPFLSPIIAALGQVLFPVMAAASARKDPEEAKSYLKLAGICSLIIIGTIAFLALSTYFLPLVWTSAILVGIVALSVIFNVQKIMKKP